MTSVPRRSSVGISITIMPALWISGRAHNAVSAAVNL